MDYKADIMACKNASEIENLLSAIIQGIKNEIDRKIAINEFSRDLNELIGHGKLTFRSGQLNYIPFTGVQFPKFTADTVLIFKE